MPLNKIVTKIPGRAWSVLELTTGMMKQKSSTATSAISVKKCRHDQLPSRLDCP
jgi:hypothetical protein